MATLGHLYGKHLSRRGMHCGSWSALRCNVGLAPSPFGSVLLGLVYRGCTCVSMIGPNIMATHRIAKPHNKPIRKLNKEDEMSTVRVLVGTRKGAFVLTSDGKRDKWEVSGPHFG